MKIIDIKERINDMKKIIDKDPKKVSEMAIDLVKEFKSPTDLKKLLKILSVEKSTEEITYLWVKIMELQRDNLLDENFKKELLDMIANKKGDGVIIKDNRLTLEDRVNALEINMMLLMTATPQEKSNPFMGYQMMKNMLGDHNEKDPSFETFLLMQLANKNSNNTLYETQKEKINNKDTSVNTHKWLKYFVLDRQRMYPAFERIYLFIYDIKVNDDYESLVKYVIDEINEKYPLLLNDEIIKLDKKYKYIYKEVRRANENIRSNENRALFAGNMCNIIETLYQKMYDVYAE